MDKFWISKSNRQLYKKAYNLRLNWTYEWIYFGMKQIQRILIRKLKGF